jgi:hypothetical protein
MRPAILCRIAVLTAAVSSLLSPLPARAQDGTWSSVTGGLNTPGPRREHGAIFDRAHQRYLIFNGREGPADPYVLMNDVWVLDVSGTPTWSHMTINGALPGERHSPQWGYDAARNRVLIFGGYGKHYPTSPSYEYLNDVWQLSLEGDPQWTELFPAGQTPTGRLAGAAVYDPMRQRFVGFGGTINAPVDTWVLNLRGEPAWQPLPIDGNRPNGGWGMTSVYDAKGDRMLIFGGSIDDSYYGSNNDVWELSLRGLPQWTKLAPSGVRPKARRSGAAIFDALRNRMVIYGGFDAVPGSDQFVGDTWALDFNVDPPAWTELQPAGTIPSGRDAVSAAYDPLSDRMIVYGGWSGTNFLQDTEFLGWSGISAEAQMSATTSTTPSTAHIEWNVQNATGPNAAVYRRNGGGVWSALAEAEVDATGHMAYDDATVSAGNQYDYMMVVGSQRGETFGGAATVTVPIATGVNEEPRAEFALRRVVPNPATDHMTVMFALSSSQPARLELLDALGRRRLGREVGTLGAGDHRIELSTAGEIPAGLYFLRLTQAGHTATTRLAIMGR